IDLFQFRFALDVETVNALLQRISDLLWGFANTGKRAFAGLAAGGEHTIEFTAGNNVETSAGVGQQFQDGAIGVCLDGVANEVIQRRQRSVQPSVVIENGSRAVNIRRGTESFGHLGQIDLFTEEPPLPILKTMHARI